MSKLFSFIIVGGLLLVAIASVHIQGVEASRQSGFIQVSVLSENQADYGVDENDMTIPAVSMSIIEDKVRDIQRAASVPVIRYTSLPQDPEIETAEEEDQEPVKEIKHNHGNGQGNGGDNGNHGSNSNGGGNGGNNGNHGSNSNGEDNGNPDKGKEKDKDKDRDKKEREDKGKNK